MELKHLQDEVVWAAEVVKLRIYIANRPRWFAHNNLGV